MTDTTTTHEFEPETLRPQVDLARASDGRIVVGLTYFDAEGYGVRSRMVRRQEAFDADSCMIKTAVDLARTIRCPLVSVGVAVDA